MSSVIESDLPVAGPAAAWQPSEAVYATFLLTLVNIFNFVDRTSFSVLVQPIKIDLGLSDSQVGFISGFAFVAIYAAVALPLARLADWSGRRRVLAGCVAFWGLMCAACGFAQSFVQLAVARMAVGAGEGGCQPSSYALLAQAYPPERRALPIAIVTTGAAVGIALGLGACGLLAAKFGWRTAFVVIGLPGVILALLVAWTLPEPAVPSRDSPASVRTSGGVGGVLRDLFRIRTYRWILGAHALHTFASGGSLSWLPAFFMRSHGMSVAGVGMFFGLSYGIGAAVGLMLGAWIIARLARSDPHRSLRWSGYLMLMSFPTFVCALSVPNLGVSLGLMLSFGALAGGAVAPLIAGLQGVVRDNARATATAVSMFSASYLGAGLGPWLIGMGAEGFAGSFGGEALRVVLQVASVTTVLCALCLLRASRTYRGDAVLG